MNGKHYQKGKLYQVPVADLHTDPAQPRSHFEELPLQELQSSILKHGVLDPVLMRRGDNNELILVSGERRLRASMQAGLATIPAILTDGDPAEIAIVENLLREN